MKTDLNKLEELYPEMPSIPSDIEISQNAVMKPIAEISQLLGVKSNDLEQYGKYKAKIEDEVWENVKTIRTVSLFLLLQSHLLRQVKEKLVLPLVWHKPSDNLV